MSATETLDEEYALPVLVLSVGSWKAKENAMHLLPVSTRGHIESVTSSKNVQDNAHILAE